MQQSSGVYPESFVRFRQERLNIALSPQQCEAVCSVEGPVLLLAVPGSGKTTVLISRLGYMIYELGIEPESILTMTYTVAATEDMKRRFVKFFGDEYKERVEFRTINGVCSKIISYYGSFMNRRVFTLCEEGNTRKIILDILKEKLSDYPTDNDIQETATKIAYAKNMMLDDEHIRDMKCADLPFGDIYAEYRSRLRQNCLMDYDDQLVYALEILKKYPDVLEYYRKKFRYICVDEAQDTSKIQHEIIALLSGKNGNLFMVGDEDQSIYGFRAAYPEALMTFSADHPGAKIIVMNINFRSDANIVASADGFINRNLRRYEKKMQPSKPSENKIVYLSAKDRKEQYDYLFGIAGKCSEKTAVLYRDNDSALPLADRLDRAGTEFNIRTGDYGFFSHKIIRDIKNIILFAYNPFDSGLFMQIYSRLQLYIKRSDALKACEISAERKISIPGALLKIKTLSESILAGCAQFALNIRKIPDDSAYECVRRIISDMNYGRYLKKNNMSAGKIRILLMIAEKEKNGIALIERLDYLENKLKCLEYKPDCKFIMSTIHSAKGLEYPVVYLADIADGIFPSDVPTKQDMDEAVAEIKEKGRNSGNLPVYDRTMRLFEEERRLFYVAVTRAINRLYIFTFKDETSVFSQELSDALNKNSGSGIEKSVETGYDIFLSSAVPGARVRHKFYGPGVIKERNGDHVRIVFSNGKQFLFSLQTMFENRLLNLLK